MKECTEFLTNIGIIKTLQRHAKELKSTDIAAISGMTYIRFTKKSIEFLTIPNAFEEFWIYETLVCNVEKSEIPMLLLSKENANFLGHFLNVTSDKITISKEKESFLFSSGKKTLKLSGLDCNDFPVVKKTDKIFALIDIPQWSLIKLLASKVKFKQGISNLNGIYIDKNMAVATNSEYVLYVRTPGDIKFPLFFPTGIIRAFPSVLQENIKINNKDFVSIKHRNLELILNSGDIVTQNDSFPIDLVKQIIKEKKMTIGSITGKELKSIISCMIHKNNKLFFNKQKGVELTSWEDNAQFFAPFNAVVSENVTIILSETSSQTFISLANTFSEDDQVYIKINKTKKFLSVETKDITNGLIIADIEIEQ